MITFSVRCEYSQSILKAFVLLASVLHLPVLDFIARFSVNFLLPYALKPTPSHQPLVTDDDLQVKMVFLGAGDLNAAL